MKVQPSPKEIVLLQRMFNEAAETHGTRVLYKAVLQRSITSVSSEEYEWADPIEIDCIYNERPRVSLLKRLDWYTEDSEIQPSLLYVPGIVDGKEFTARRGDLVNVPSAVNPSEENWFQVSIVSTELIHLKWICNLVPYRIRESKPVTGTNSKWLNNV